MKKYILLIATSLSAACCAMAQGKTGQAEKNDTIAVVSTPSSVIITETPSGLTLDVTEKENSHRSTIVIADYSENATVSSNQSTRKFQLFSLSSSYDARECKSGRWSVISNGLNIGLVRSLDQPQDLGLQWSKSFELSWVNTIAVKYSYKTASVSLGIGLDWRNYNMTARSHRMIHDAATGISVAPYPEGSTPGNSRIKVFSLGFPLLYTQRIPGTTLALTAGGILNVNTHASLKTTYKNSLGNSVEEYAEGISRRKVSFDIYGAVYLYHGIGIYARYSPQSVLSGAGVPRFNPLSVGLTIGL